MADHNLVIDTSVFIEYLRAKDKSRTILFTIQIASLKYAQIFLYPRLVSVGIH